jgi:hypothetical protein
VGHQHHTIAIGVSERLCGGKAISGDAQFHDRRRRRRRQRIARMVHFQDRAIHVVAMLMYSAADLADVIKRKADNPLPERQLLVALVAEKAHVAGFMAGHCSGGGFRRRRTLASDLVGWPKGAASPEILACMCCLKARAS